MAQPRAHKGSMLASESNSRDGTALVSESNFMGSPRVILVSESKLETTPAPNLDSESNFMGSPRVILVSESKLTRARRADPRLAVEIGTPSQLESGLRVQLYGVTCCRTWTPSPDRHPSPLLSGLPVQFSSTRYAAWEPGRVGPSSKFQVTSAAYPRTKQPSGGSPQVHLRATRALRIWKYRRATPALSAARVTLPPCFSSIRST